MAKNSTKSKNKPKQRTCEGCEKEFKYPYLLRRHQNVCMKHIVTSDKNIHAIYHKKAKNVAYLKKVTQILEMPRSGVCLFCEVDNQYFARLGDHIRSQHPHHIAFYSRKFSTRRVKARQTVRK